VLTEIIYELDNSNSLKMYVLTNSLRINGANTILYKDVLRKFAKKLDSNLYILPSSIHEVILVPATSGVSPITLLKLVKDANEYAVTKEEWLSDNIYFYNYDADVISLVE